MEPNAIQTAGHTAMQAAQVAQGVGIRGGQAILGLATSLVAAPATAAADLLSQAPIAGQEASSLAFVEATCPPPPPLYLTPDNLIVTAVAQRYLGMNLHYDASSGIVDVEAGQRCIELEAIEAEHGICLPPTPDEAGLRPGIVSGAAYVVAATVAKTIGGIFGA